MAAALYSTIYTYLKKKAHKWTTWSFTIYGRYIYTIQYVNSIYTHATQHTSIMCTVHWSAFFRDTQYTQHIFGAYISIIDRIIYKYIFHNIPTTENGMLHFCIVKRSINILNKNSIYVYDYLRIWFDRKKHFSLHYVLMKNRCRGTPRCSVFVLYQPKYLLSPTNTLYCFFLNHRCVVIEIKPSYLKKKKL